MVAKLKRAIVGYIAEVRNFNRNIKLSLLATVLGGVAQGIFNVVFNLYILSMGITENVLGGILSAGPFAHAIASIPIGFLSELVGYKEIFVGIYAVAGIAALVQAGTTSVTLISAAAFVSGFVLTGNFVVRMPFLAANANDGGRAHVFSVDSLLFGFSAAFGALIAGYVPDFLLFLSPDLTLRYRYTLYLAGALTFLGVIPSLMLRKSAPRERKKISLHPYLWGMDGFTVKTAVIELFIGLFIGLVGPFMNLYFIYRLGTTREFYGTIEALALLPVMIATALVPVVAKRLGTLRATIAVRALVPVATFVMALTTAPWLGTAIVLGLHRRVADVAVDVVCLRDGYRVGEEQSGRFGLVGDHLLVGDGRGVVADGRFPRQRELYVALPAVVGCVRDDRRVDVCPRRSKSIR